MLLSLKSLSGQSSRLLLLLLVLTSIPSCSKGPLSLLTGGGPNVAANIQAGKTNSQTLGTTKIVEQKTESGDIKSVDSKVSAESVEKVKEKKRAASPTAVSTPKAPPKEFNPLAMSDEEFSKLVKPQYL